jgi:2-oxoglutarate dehydrogenase E1 component
MDPFPDWAQFANQEMLDALYRQFQENPASVDPSFRYFFEGMQFSKGAPSATGGGAGILDAYRRFGHLAARFNPLYPPTSFPAELQLQTPGQEASAWGREWSGEALAEKLSAIYCGPIGFEYMDLGHPELEAWIQSRIEPELTFGLSGEDKRAVLEGLNKSEVFESFLHTKYVGKKRFSLEGCETLIPLLLDVAAKGAELGLEEVVIGMAHRGRLNVLANLLNKPFSVIFQEFEDSLVPFSFEGSGDVKYHKGFSAQVGSLHLYLAANSSALESVDPVVLGQARALQDRLGQKKVCPLLIHGDAAIAGQGVVYECLEMSRLPGYTTGGTLHIVINNQIGYTTNPEEGRSTRYCTDIAKSFGAPVFHVSAEEPEAALFCLRLALEIRRRFAIDVFIDLNGYRKYGHNETDEPLFTHPLQYQAIRSRPSIRQIYLNKLIEQGAQDRALAEKMELEFREALAAAQAEKVGKISYEQEFGERFSRQKGAGSLLDPFEAPPSLEQIVHVGEALCRVPPGFSLNPKLVKWNDERAKAIAGKRAVDWALAESLAFGTLLTEQIPVRLSGQDVRRGTFSQRHAVWVDVQNGSFHCPLDSLSPDQARFHVYNSPLSEYGVLGFEFGYTWADTAALVLWEAQFGDFVNGAQILIDQYLVAGEQKWARSSSLTLLLPHGYEGMGPEHSSGRIERFLQLASDETLQVAYPSTPAQYFHLLRRQALRPLRKPLVVFTPKSLLRAVESHVAELAQGRFLEVLDDSTPCPGASTGILCSGKIYYDLLKAREKKGANIPLIRIEQLYPLHTQLLASIIARYPTVRQWRFVQEEPANMGAWSRLSPLLSPLVPSLQLVSRPESSASASGSQARSTQEHLILLNEAFA